MSFVLNQRVQYARETSRALAMNSHDFLEVNMLRATVTFPRNTPQPSDNETVDVLYLELHN